MTQRGEELAALAERIETIAKDPGSVAALDDDTVRRRLRDAGTRLTHALETKNDSIHRIAYSPMHLALARVGVDIGLFELMGHGTRGSTSAELANKTGVDIVLMRRLLRFYQSVGMILQRGEDDFVSNNVTNALAWEGGRAGIRFQSDLVAQSLLALPEFLSETHYANPTDSKHTPFHLGLRTQQDLFQWMQEHPDVLEDFNVWMSYQRDPRITFLDVLDIEKEFGQDMDASTVLFVDIGGSRGHQSVAVRRKYPYLPGRVIVQDLAHTIAQNQSSPLPGLEEIEMQAHDMFTPQTIKGARAYYFRNVFHDWPDEQCREILENLKPALSHDSTVLIDETVVSEVGAPWRATLGDVVMAACLAARERTESEWRCLADEAGFRVVKVLKYREEVEDCVILLRLK
ncbi:S-adenosyl-L-methionine-dependent methyltransferase [Coniochaeta sp. 2T2.1]|nr:S-adenosyl-L-methionine-dependent methyltransferase [Coniochaeta sp. 2T2.1]